MNAAAALRAPLPNQAVRAASALAAVPAKATMWTAAALLAATPQPAVGAAVALSASRPRSPVHTAATESACVQEPAMGTGTADEAAPRKRTMRAGPAFNTAVPYLPVRAAVAKPTSASDTVHAPAVPLGLLRQLATNDPRKTGRPPLLPRSHRLRG
mmetsp:Transcript_54219/g.117199  ORF Transcript_54219/g.117199 Transcript_54219/m.117199 type:complete len:156 (-) Transcript_54219:334-801(-)